VSRRRGDWEPIANRILSAHAPSLRMRAGAAASAAAALPLLERAHLPFQLRRWLGLELAIRHGLQPAFDPGALMRVQRSWLAAARQPPRQQPGAWDVPRPSPPVPPLGRGGR
jgi:hypothetical protein